MFYSLPRILAAREVSLKLLEHSPSQPTNTMFSSPVGEPSNTQMFTYSEMYKDLVRMWVALSWTLTEKKSASPCERLVIDILKQYSVSAVAEKYQLLFMDHSSSASNAVHFPNMGPFEKRVFIQPSSKKAAKKRHRKKSHPKKDSR